MNNILQVAYGHKKNNKTIHLTLGGLGVTALSDLLEGKNTKDSQNLLRKNVPDTLFNYFILKQFLRPNRNHRLESPGPNASLDTKILKIDLCHILMSYT
jgi:hypothetical protein